MQDVTLRFKVTGRMNRPLKQPVKLKFGHDISDAFMRPTKNMFCVNMH